MKKKNYSLFQLVRRHLLDKRTSLTDLLWMLYSLGIQTKSVRFRDLLLKELQGYDPAEKLPHYRQVGGTICLEYLDARNNTRTVHTEDTVFLYDGVPEIEELLNSGARHFEIPIPDSVERVAALNASLAGRPAKVIRLYWSISREEAGQILKEFRRNLSELYDEIASGASADGTEPDKKTADQAAFFFVNARDGVVNFNIRSAGGVVNVVENGKHAPESVDPSWRWWIMAVAAVLAAVVALVTWLGWTPWS